MPKKAAKRTTKKNTTKPAVAVAMSAKSTKGTSGISTMQKLAWGYAALFFGVVSLGYIPGFTDDHGMLFGLFSIQLIDDLLHLFSGIWATYGAWKSEQAATFYFKWFGLYYTADAFLGFFTGYTILNLVFMQFDANVGFHMMDMQHNIAVNLPHFIIGPVALLLGHVVSKRLQRDGQKA